MAKIKLSKADYVQHGYGQVEPNHLSARRTGQIYAQLPCNSEIEVLENGQFAKYDYANKEVNFTGAGEWMLVFNEIKLYEDRQQDDDFAMIKANYIGSVYDALGATLEGKVMTPRLLKTNIGDLFTTNCINVGEETDLEGKTLKVGADGYLTLGNDDNMEWTIVKVYTLADTQKAVKIQRTK